MSYAAFYSPETWVKTPLHDRINLARIYMDQCDRRRREYRRMGWVYVVRNPALRDPVFKVGESSRFPVERAQELSAETGVLGAYELVYFIHAGDRKAAEGLAHRLLDPHRVSRSKEFFQAPLGVILGALDRAAATFPVWGGTQRKPEPLPQPFLVARVKCSICGAIQNVRELLIPVKTKCRDCGLGFG